MTAITTLDINRILASYLFGLLGSACLFGVITIQTYIYYQKFPNDSRYVRCLVALFWIMEGVDLGISTRGAYRELVPNGVAGLLALLEQPWYMSYFGTHDVVIAFMVQTFFVTRFWTVSRNLPATISFILLVTAGLGLGLYITIRSYMFPDSATATLNAASTSVQIAWMSFNASADIILAVALAIELRSRQTGYSN
ncbi:hypothetical protein DL93DRAFT_2170860 [Clavulina sp. PMI_390]|nr:hypothetical protein DL93DRAFT_2170860 [Clavulina sp. PMI_390]